MSERPRRLSIDLETVSDHLLAELRALYPGQPHKEAIWRWQFAPRLGRNCVMLTARDEEHLILMPLCRFASGGKAGR